MKKATKQIHHYLPLIGILVAGVIGFSIFSFDKTFQSVIAIAMAGGYVSWGIVHHHLHKDLYVSVILEYLAVAFLGLVIIFSVILRS